jgi:hypothetical protein
MSPRPSSEFARRVVAAVFVAAIALAAGAHQVGAASPDFGTPRAVSTFGQGIDFTQPYSGPAFTSAEIAVTLPGAIAPMITQLEGQSSSSLKYTLDASQGQLLPNMKIGATFDVTLANGTVEAGPAVNVTYADTRVKWQTVTAGVVTIHYYSGSSSFAQQLGAVAQQGLAKSTSLLGVNETEPLDFFVYGDQQSFLYAMGPATSGDVGGEAKPEFRTCFAQINAGDLTYARSVIPHELTHVVFADAVHNPYHDPLNWFNEGMAVYLSDGYTSDSRQRVAQAASKGTLMPLAALTGAFPRITDRFYLAYAEAVSAVDFLVRKYGQADVAKLLSTYRTGATDDEAFQAAIGIDTVAFDKTWLAANGVNSYQTFGPQPAPTGPLPPGWGSSAGGAVPTPTASEAASAATPGASGSSQPTGAKATRNPTLEALGIAGVLSTIALVLLVAGFIIHRKSQGGAP